MDSTPLAEVKNNVGFFDRYQNVTDPQVRLKIAEDFLLREAGDKWIFVYATIASKINEENEANQESSREVQRTVESEVKEGVVNPVVKIVREYQDHYQFRQAFLKAYIMDRSSDEKFNELNRELEIADDDEWKDVSKLLYDGDDPQIGINVEWLRFMIKQGRVDIQDKGNSSENGILSFTNSGLSVETSDPPTLHITPDLIPANRTAVSILLGLSHERGHVIRLESRKYLTEEIGQTEIVLSEFYSICEEYRLYHMLPENLRNQVHEDAVKYLYEPNVSNLNYSGTLPNSNINVNVKLDAETFILYRAYAHALQQNIGARKILFEKLTQGAEDVDSAKRYWGDVLKIKENEPVISNNELNWKVVS